MARVPVVRVVSPSGSKSPYMLVNASDVQRYGYTIYEGQSEKQLEKERKAAEDNTKKLRAKTAEQVAIDKKKVEVSKRSKTFHSDARDFEPTTKGMI